MSHPSANPYAPPSASGRPPASPVQDDVRPGPPAPPAAPPAAPAPSPWVWPARLVGALLVAVLVAFGAGSVVVQFFVRETTRTTQVPADQVDEVLVDTATGDIRVSRADPGAGVRVTTTRRTAFEQATVDQSVRDGVLDVHAECTSRWFLDDTCAVDVDVAVPDGTSLRLRDATGGILVVGTVGDVSVETATGGIRLLDVRADTVTAQVATGSIDATFAAPPTTVRARSAVGRIKIVVPADGTAYRVDAQTAVGTPTVDVEQDATSPRSIEVSTAVGEAIVTVEAGAGS